MDLPYEPDDIVDQWRAFMDIEINVYAAVICDCGRKLVAEVSREKDKQTIIVKPCEHCMDEAAKDAS